jgi:hypothetical protein
MEASLTFRVSPGTMENERVRNPSRNDPGQPPEIEFHQIKAQLKNRF